MIKTKNFCFSRIPKLTEEDLAQIKLITTIQIPPFKTKKHQPINDTTLLVPRESKTSRNLDTLNLVGNKMTMLAKARRDTDHSGCCTPHRKLSLIKQQTEFKKEEVGSNDDHLNWYQIHKKVS